MEQKYFKKLSQIWICISKNNINLQQQQKIYEKILCFLKYTFQLLGQAFGHRNIFIKMNWSYQIWNRRQLASWIPYHSNLLTWDPLGKQNCPFFFSVVMKMYKNFACQQDPWIYIIVAHTTSHRRYITREWVQSIQFSRIKFEVRKLTFVTRFKPLL